MVLARWKKITNYELWIMSFELWTWYLKVMSK
jgi:hypothetical protein